MFHAVYYIQLLPLLVTRRFFVCSSYSCAPATNGLCAVWQADEISVPFEYCSQKIVTLFLGVSEAKRTTTHNYRRTRHPPRLCFDAMSGKKARARKQKRERRDANAANTANAGEAIPGLFNDIVVTHVLRSGHFDDPADLARLPAVSRAMRDAVAATGLRFEELGEIRAANLGCLSAVQRLQRQGRLSRQERLCYAAAMSGQLEELKVLHADNTPWDRSTCRAAARSGHLKVLQWARANGCPWDERTCAEAARGGHLEVLQWLRANGCPWDKDTCTYAAGGGQLKVLQWARANGCPCDEKTCFSAAQEGHFEVLRWVCANGCPRDKNELHIAAEMGHEAVVRALIELGADVNRATDKGCTPLYNATRYGHEAVVRALIELGADVHKVTNDGETPLSLAAEWGHVAVVRALIESDADVNKGRNDAAFDGRSIWPGGGGAGADRVGRGFQQGGG